MSNAHHPLSPAPSEPNEYSLAPQGIAASDLPLHSAPVHGPSNGVNKGKNVNEQNVVVPHISPTDATSEAETPELAVVQDAPADDTEDADVEDVGTEDKQTPHTSPRREVARSAYEVSATSATRHAEFDRLFALWRETGDPRLRDRLILMNRNLVSFVARKFMDRGEMSEDIMQQGLIGLINALDHFDPTRGARFATFATPTIMGEIRRYLRDKTWGVRVPRRLHELNMLINSRIEILTAQFDRSPTYAEIARALGLELEEVIEALEMVHALEPVSIDETLPTARGETAMSIGEQIGHDDADLEGWNDHALLQAALEKLPERERQVLQMVYFEEKSQTEIARHMKVSQMNISRLQRRALAHLRELMNSNDF